MQSVKNILCQLGITRCDSRPGQRCSMDQEGQIMEPAVERYGDIVPWELPVQLCIKDFLHSGDNALDIGANIGGLSIAMSRLVGGSGQIHAFEANPFTARRLIRNLEANQASNVQVVPYAAWVTSGQQLPFYCDDSYYAAASSLLYESNTGQRITVETVSVDDYCQKKQIVPSVMKLDIEGAEYWALCGAAQTLKSVSPVIVLEYYPAETDDKDPLSYLAQLGYCFYDVNLYEPVDRNYYLTRFSPLRLANVLALPQSRSDAYASLRLIPKRAITVVSGSTESELIDLDSAGRYQIAVEFVGPADVEAALSVESEQGIQLAFFQAPVRHLQYHTSSCLVIEARATTGIRVKIRAIGEAGSGVFLSEIRVTEIKK